MIKLLACLLTFVLSGTALAHQRTEIRKEPLSFGNGTTVAMVKGHITGRSTVDYLVRAKAGQTITVRFTPDNLSAYFNILPPGTETAIFVGSTSGNSFEGRLPVDGEYRIRVYLMRSAARRKETAHYTLSVDLGAAAIGPSFEKTLELQGIRFRVTSSGNGSINTLRIVPSGLEIDNSPLERVVEGTVTGAEVGDINADGSPEIYVYITSAGSGSYGSLVAYSANRRKSLSEIYLSPLTDNAQLAAGYRGHDEFALLEGIIARRFPLYRDSDTNAGPSGGIRQLQYKLVPGESCWQLILDRVVEF